jgi:4-O-beta-D-mannosyl-D-glucose phosphorylase
MPQHSPLTPDFHFVTIPNLFNNGGPMTSNDFQLNLKSLSQSHESLLSRPNPINPDLSTTLFTRYRHPVVTADHIPLDWRYDFNPKTNPHLLERLAVNAAFNPGAIEWNGKFLLVCRVEGVDRKSFFAIAESASGTDNFRFWPEPLVLPETPDPDTNVYDMRLIAHEDGCIYGLFCTERKDRTAPPSDTSSAFATSSTAFSAICMIPHA